MSKFASVIAGSAVVAAIVAAPQAQAQGYGALQRQVAHVEQGIAHIDSIHIDSVMHVDTTADMIDAPFTFESNADSLDFARSKARAEKATGFRVLVSLEQRHVWVIDADDTLLSVPAAVAKGTSFSFGGREWTFKTPRGVRTVLDKTEDPIWQPPDWEYAEVADEYGLKLAYVPTKGSIKLEDGRQLTIRDNRVGVIDSTGEFAVLPVDEHVVFGQTLYVPPMGSVNREVKGELGKYRLNLGDGYLMHGTPMQSSIGRAATHGCIRLRDEDIEWVYNHVPVGTKVYIF